MHDYRIILDATIDFSLYDQRFNHYLKRSILNKQEHYINNYRQLIIQIFDQLAVNSNLALGSPNLNLEYFIMPENDNDFLENLIQCKMEIALTILTNLNRQNLLNNGLLKDYYLLETSNIMHILAPSIPILRQG